MYDTEEQSITTTRPIIFQKRNLIEQTSSAVTFSPQPQLKQKMFHVTVTRARLDKPQVFVVDKVQSYKYHAISRGVRSPVLTATTFDVTKEVPFSTLKFENTVLEIKNGRTILAKLSFEADRVIAYNDEFPVYGFGNTRMEALEDFQQSFIDFYLNVVECSEAILDEPSKELRRHLNSIATIRING